MCPRCVKFYSKYPLVKDDDGILYHNITGEYQLGEVKCAFRKAVFYSGNYCCQTIEALRDCLDYKDRNKDLSIGVKAIPANAGEGHVVLLWYKNRGRVSNAYILAEDYIIYPLTLRMAEGILEKEGK